MLHANQKIWYGCHDDCVNCLHHGSFLSTETTQGECMWLNTEHDSVDFVDAEHRHRIPFEHLLTVKWMHAMWWMMLKWMPVAAPKLTHNSRLQAVEWSGRIAWIRCFWWCDMCVYTRWTRMTSHCLQCLTCCAHEKQRLSITQCHALR